jgi:hypothetical protein
MTTGEIIDRIEELSRTMPDPDSERDLEEATDPDIMRALINLLYSISKGATVGSLR